MAADDDIERLLREVEGLEGGSAAKKPAPGGPAPTQPAPGTDLEAASRTRSARMQWTLYCAIGGGIIGLLVGMLLTFLPGLSGLGTGLGAALGASVAGYASGPPSWFRKE